VISHNEKGKEISNEKEAPELIWLDDESSDSVKFTLVES
jgi:hypothetical protein